jgi:ADP-heptose:LPS heptosyltransferase
MNILFAPFARKAPHLKGLGNPKDYPFAKELAKLLCQKHLVTQVGGEADEQLVQDFRKNLSFDQMSELIKSHETAVCVDSYLQHHMWFLNKKAIVLWGVSDPLFFGHSLHLNLLKDRKYLREKQFDLYYSNQFNSEAFVSPEEVLKAIDNLYNGVN